MSHSSQSEHNVTNLPQDVENYSLDPDFSAGPFVTRRQTSASELTSMLDTLYLGDDEDDNSESDQNPVSRVPTNGDGNDNETVGVHDANVETEAIETVHGSEQTTQGVSEDLAHEVSLLKEQLDKLEVHMRDSHTSSLNRESTFRDYVNGSFAELERNFTAGLEKLEKDVVNCLLRRDEKWKKQFNKFRTTSTPHPHRTTVSSESVTPTFPSNVPQPSLFSQSGAAPYYPKPPVRIDFPSFGTSSDSSDVFSFIEQCENYLDL